MESYVDNNLIKGEKVVYKGVIHWLIYALPIFKAIISLIFALSVDNGFLKFVFATAVVYFIVKAVQYYIYTITTEFVITNKRVIAKFGLIKRITAELNHNQLESVNVDQSIIERMFNAGSLIMQGTGGNKTPIIGVDSPLEFRKKAMEITDKNSK
ncbi:MAG TPA: hypothetical protein DCL21_04270 [Alphaproteobacteria bacterium]|nr:hypothetical protein [Alphaproteobacteria bacterium]